MAKKSKRGFTLIELMIVVAILGVVIAVALPTYFEQIVKSRRTDGQVALLDLAAKMERYYAENHTFVGATLTNMAANASTAEGYYNLNIQSQTASSFLLQAIPQGDQASRDSKCATLQINQLNQKTTTGTGSAKECW